MRVLERIVHFGNLEALAHRSLFGLRGFLPEFVNDDRSPPDRSLLAISAFSSVNRVRREVELTGSGRTGRTRVSSGALRGLAVGTVGGAGALARAGSGRLAAGTGAGGTGAAGAGTGTGGAAVGAGTGAAGTGTRGTGTAGTGTGGTGAGRTGGGVTGTGGGVGVTRCGR